MYAGTRSHFDVLQRKLERLRADYQLARSRGDDERARQFHLQLAAVASEHDRLLKMLVAAAKATLPGRPFI